MLAYSLCCAASQDGLGIQYAELGVRTRSHIADVRIGGFSTFETLLNLCFKIDT